MILCEGQRNDDTSQDTTATRHLIRATCAGTVTPGKVADRRTTRPCFNVNLSPGGRDDSLARRRSTSSTHSQTEAHRRASRRSHAPDTRRKRPAFRLVVVGASAGGVEALVEVVRALPAKLPAAILITLHVAPDSQSFLPEILHRAGKFSVSHATDGERIHHGDLRFGGGKC